MAEKDIPVSSFELGRMELQKSPIYEKIPEAERKCYIEESLRYGQEAADKMLKKNKSIFQLLDENKIKLEKKESRKVGGAFTLRGEINFDKVDCSITVNEESIQSIYRGGRQSLPKELILSQKQALEVHLSHEFFHYLEFKSGETVSERLPKARVPLFLKLSHQVEVIECSEIAAHAFAKQFCHLKVLPNYYDLHYIRQHDVVCDELSQKSKV